MATTATMPRHDLLINGEFVKPAAGEYVDVYNPATGEVIASVAAAGIHDADVAVRAAREALQGKWATMTPARRARVINKMATLALKPGRYALGALKREDSDSDDDEPAGEEPAT